MGMQAFAMGTQALSGGLQAFGAIKSAKGEGQQFLYQSQVAENNAIIARENAEAELSAGAYAQSRAGMETTALIADQTAAQAANGLDISLGSPVAVREASARIGALDRAMIHYNAAREAYGLERQAQEFGSESEMLKIAAKNAKRAGYMKAAGTLLGTASSISGMARQYKIQGSEASVRASQAALHGVK